MKQLLYIGLLVISCTSKPSKKNMEWPKNIPQPIAAIKPFEMVAHGDKRVDNYYWLNDYFKKGADSAKVLDYLNAENSYTDTMMNALKPFQVKLFSEMKGRIKEQDESVPVFRNGYYYYTRTEQGKQYYKYCRKKGSLEAAEEILLDIDAMAEGQEYFAATGFSVSPDNKLLAYGVDKLSRRQYNIYIKNLETGELLADEIPNTEGEIAWAADNKTFYYTGKNPQTLLSEKIMRHRLGESPMQDEVVYQEKDPSNYIGVYKTKSDRFIFLYSSATLSSEYWYLDATDANAEFKLFQKRIPNVLYAVDHWEDRFLITTNKDGAKNFKLMETPLNKTEAPNWKEVIPHREDVFLEDVNVFKNFWAISERKNGLLQLRIRDLATQNDTYLDFGEPAYTAYPTGNAEYVSDILRYRYTSLTTPNSIYDYNRLTKEKILLKQQEVLGSFKVEDYITERVYATANDGVKIPISLVYHKSTKKDGSAPLWLYGYGSYGISMDAAFDAARLSMLNRGFVFAIAHIRGGQELGRQWYEEGKMMKKENTFNDFIACGEYLIAQNYTSKGHLYASGGSAGGLLMGAVVNKAPQLWNGVIADVPFVDVVTTMSDPTIPLTTNEYDEWGNPANKEHYEYIKKYSPYDNVEAKEYPNMLVLTGLHDSQVQYFEPAKWVAKLRVMKTDKNLLLFKTNMGAGHGGASGRFDYLKETALKYSFFLALEGIYE